MDRIGLLKIGGVCAVSYAVGLFVLLGLLAAAGMMEASGAAEMLPAFVEHTTTVATAAWILVVLPVLVAIVGLSLFRALRHVGSLVWVAALTFVGGAFLILYRPFVWLAVIHELAPAYMQAPDATREALAAVGDTLERFAHMADLIGAVLVAGIGALLFSLAVLRTSFAAKWTAWLGIFAAITGGWLTLLVSVGPVFELINFVGTMAWVAWMVAMGVALWRAPEPEGH